MFKKLNDRNANDTMLGSLETATVTSVKLIHEFKYQYHLILRNIAFLLNPVFHVRVETQPYIHNIMSLKRDGLGFLNFLIVIK